ncbi:8-demethyl-8-alpha-L-rhamnosyl tetracenomycin-C 2'-O-methyltransferase [Cyphellophora attinorum]|uniref:8-demethyl-8-alpha-L-rhamnosyl tetracenomycin-C 2'-O-methyltransferase n=1 Tax=Cyphellophora attinorum TaxID=1664694 RepID=A0A0N1P0L1_9EURO|nr:8-demethyl-8-alpha-L-rhamnosyl tetracenomycin-C 2'-O-methyltransferase [Phialophora attinorum]KPI43467.1 8-demethyl-8-alpha-L-rhamnosyl tetracenomycin-C 2'-O-methyltransferase [Phialophora attinorum]
MAAFTTPKNKVILGIAAVAAFVFVLAAIKQTGTDQGQHLEHLSSAISYTKDTVLSPFKSSKTFYEIAKAHGTDKVSMHSYQEMYQKYFPAIRGKRLKMLEIGLGCDMGYGPGASYYTWLEYFPNVDLYYMEFDAACAKEWAHKTTGATVTTGDQGDPAVLEAFIAKHGGDFDIIIDDGGHTMDQQKTSLQHLWKAVKPGGLYFCEDLETSFMPAYAGGTHGEPATMGETMVGMISRMIEDLNYPAYGSYDVAVPRQIVFDDIKSLVHIDCSRHVCVFEKRLT